MQALENFATDLQSPYWWVTVVVVGVLINIGSAYLKSPIDRALGSISSRRRAKNERRARQLEEESNNLAGDLQLFTLEVSLQTRDMVLSLQLLALAATFGFFLVLLSPYSLRESPLKFVFSIILAAAIFTTFTLSNVFSSRAMAKLEVIAIARNKLRTCRVA